MLGIKLIKPCNLKCTGSFTDFSESHYNSADICYRRNDLNLSCNDDGVVQWDRELSTKDLAEFLEVRSSGGFQCCVCGKDASLSSGSGGYAQCASTEREGCFEEKHILNLVPDVPSFVKCLQCHRREVPCKFFRSGWCSRGTSCAYLH